MTNHAVRLESAGAAVTVVSAEEAVTAWATRYFGTWWHTAETDPAGRSGPRITARVDPQVYEDSAYLVTREPYRNTTYAGAPLLLAADVSSGVIRAVSPWARIAYRSEPGAGSLEVSGCHTKDIATATARLAREMMRGQLLRDGWAVLHASAVVGENGRTVLTLGSKGAGKTTAALALAARHGLGLLANDRVFVRANVGGGVDVLPWPSAAALGLGLLSGLGWTGIVQERLEAGERLHPTQSNQVTLALLAGYRKPVWGEETGAELKAQVWPDQFPSWFGVPLAAEGVAAALVFPRVEASAAPAVEETSRTVGDGDFMIGRTEDRYPDVFGLLGVDGGGTEGARRSVARLLAGLPHHAVVLGHDATANADLLAKVIGCA
ncbi:hypothetical protein [Streptomyces salinarius]|uniref:hypothetical protein n=1 Tax=Streptomyces salinarius TaxID=2762598 RepID=UPI002852CC8A|nr:hypothetical protein [Streptomyces salinarius]